MVYECNCHEQEHDAPWIVSPSPYDHPQLGNPYRSLEASPEASCKRQACPALQGEVEGWQGVLFGACQSECKQLGGT